MGVNAATLRLMLVIPGLGGGGAERILTGIANRWSRAGHEVEIVTLRSAGGDTYPLDPRVGRTALDLHRDSGSALEGVLQGTRRVLALRDAMTRFSPDAVISFIRSTNVYALLAAAPTGTPVFVSERTDPRLDPGAQRRRGWALLRRLLYPQAAGLVVQTESVAAWARRFCRRVHVIPNFVERPAHMARPGVEDGPKRLLAMGRLGPEKGFDLLLEAFARVAPAHPDWSLVILGEGRERVALEALVRSRGLAGRVALPGRVADPVPHLAAAHAFALSSRREGFPNALVEAMAVGLPVVAFACRSGPSEIISDGEDGLLVPDGDVAALAAALARLMGSASERQRLGERARGVADRFDPEKVLLQWTAVMSGGSA